MYSAGMKIGDTEVLTISQAAQRLGLDRTTLVRQAKKGKLRATMTGAFYLVTVEEVERYRRENLGKPGRKPRDEEA